VLHFTDGSQALRLIGGTRVICWTSVVVVLCFTGRALILASHIGLGLFGTLLGPGWAARQVGSIILMDLFIPGYGYKYTYSLDAQVMGVYGGVPCNFSIPTRFISFA